MSVAINPGTVVWCGDNPGIYLKDPARPELPFGTLSLFFRVVISPHGAGRAIIVLADPAREAGFPSVANLCITDNESLMRWMVPNFVAHFGAFRGVPALQAMSWHAMRECATHTDGDALHAETLRADGVEATLSWHGLQVPFAADVPPSMTATGEHQMTSVFRGAREASVTVNGVVLPGQPVMRDFLGGRLNSAFLAFAETWVTPRGAA